MERVILERALEENAEEEFLGERRGDHRDEETKEEGGERPRRRTGTNQEARERVLRREVFFVVGRGGEGRAGFGVRRGVGGGRVGRRDGDRVWKSIFGCEKIRCYETLDKQRAFPSQTNPLCQAGHTAGWNGRFGESAQTSGVEKLSPRSEEICRRFMFSSRCSKSFRKTVADLVGKVNAEPFRGWECGEVLLREVEISEPFENDLNQTLIELKCTFAIRRNRSNAVWQDIAIGSVQGWEHVWGTSYADPNDRSLKSSCAYVGKLYSCASFGILGLEE